ncbi:MAG TPA: hypothetical protein VF605_18945 [Allosphingosinicella sp.]|jgi:hypothetical protein
MTFISDHERRKTFDPERDLELVYERAMSDGTEFMALIGPTGAFHFTMTTTFEPAAAGAASAKPVIVRHVPFRGPFHGGCLNGHSVEETKALIVEALEAFKGIYGLHPDETVRVIFT